MSSRIEVTDYLLGELGPAERAEAERLERDDPAFRREVERLRPIVTGLEGLPREAWDVDAPPLPPASAAEGLRRAPLPARRRFLPRLRLGAPVAVAVAVTASVLLLAVGVGIGLLLGSGGGEALDLEGATALERVPGAPSDAGGEVQVRYGEDGRAALRVSGLPPNAGDDFYELWLLNDAKDLVSLGTFRVAEGGEARLEVPVPVEAGLYSFFDISREPADGDPSHSGESVLRAPA